jgi:hypothetical protein
VHNFLLPLRMETLPLSSASVDADRSKKDGPGELAEWVTAGGLRLMLREGPSRGSVVSSGPVVSEKELRAIVRQAGRFVARLNGSGVFEGLWDREIIVDTLACSAAEQATPV